MNSVRGFNTGNVGYLQRYLDYINNAGNPTIEQFDEDWDPVGPKVRDDMIRKGLIYIDQNKIYENN